MSDGFEDTISYSDSPAVSDDDSSDTDSSDGGSDNPTADALGDAVSDGASDASGGSDSSDGSQSSSGDSSSTSSSDSSSTDSVVSDNPLGVGSVGAGIGVGITAPDLPSEDGSSDTDSDTEPDVPTDGNEIGGTVGGAAGVDQSDSGSSSDSGSETESDVPTDGNEIGGTVGGAAGVDQSDSGPGSGSSGGSDSPTEDAFGVGDSGTDTEPDVPTDGNEIGGTVGGAAGVDQSDSGSSSDGETDSDPDVPTDGNEIGGTVGGAAEVDQSDSGSSSESSGGSDSPTEDALGVGESAGDDLGVPEPPSESEPTDSPTEDALGDAVRDGSESVSDTDTESGTADKNEDSTQGSTRDSSEPTTQDQQTDGPQPPELPGEPVAEDRENQIVRGLAEQTEFDESQIESARRTGENEYVPVLTDDAQRERALEQFRERAESGEFFDFATNENAVEDVRQTDSGAYVPVFDEGVRNFAARRQGAAQINRQQLGQIAQTGALGAGTAGIAQGIPRFVDPEDLRVEDGEVTGLTEEAQRERVLEQFRARAERGELDVDPDQIKDVEKTDSGQFRPVLDQNQQQSTTGDSSNGEPSDALIAEAARETDFTEQEIRDVLNDDVQDVSDLPGYGEVPTQDGPALQRTSAPAPGQNEALLSPNPDELTNPAEDRVVFREVKPQLEDELGVEIEREDVNLNKEDGEVSVSLTNEGADKAEGEEEFGDAPLGDDYLRDAGQFINENVVDPVAETSGDVVGTGVETVAGEQAGENAEAVTEGTVGVTGSLLNIPNTTAGLMEVGEFIGYGGAQVVQGEGMEYAEKSTDAAKQALSSFADYAQENPYRAAGQVGGSLALSTAIMGGAAKYSQTAGRAAAYTIQPGEEIAGLAGNQALTRTGSGLTKIGNRASASGKFDVSGEAARRIGARTEQSADVFFPQNEPLIFSEEAAIMTGRAVRDRVSSRLGSARDTITGETALSPTPRQRELIDLGRPGSQTEAGTDTTDAPGATSEVGSDTEEILDATTTPRETETEAQQDNPPSYRPGRESGESETSSSGATEATESSADSDLPLQEEVERAGGVRPYLRDETPLPYSAIQTQETRFREFIGDESAQLEFASRQRGRGQRQQDPTDPEFEPTQDDLLSGSPRDQISTDVSSRNLEQRRQNQGTFEAERDPVGEAESRREQAQRQEVTQERELDGRSEVTRAEVGAGAEPSLNVGIASEQLPFVGSDVDAGTDVDVGPRSAAIPGLDTRVGVQADVRQQVGLETALDQEQRFETEQEQEFETETETETEFETEFETEAETETEIETELEPEQENEVELFTWQDNKGDEDGQQALFGGDVSAFGTDFFDPLTGNVLETDVEDT